MVRPAYADDCEPSTSLNIKTVTVDGVQGTFIEPVSMNRLTFVLTTCLPRYKHLIAAQDDLINAQARTIGTSSVALVMAARIADEEHERAERWKAAFKDVSTSDALPSELWLGIGVALGVGAMVGAVFLVREMEEP